MSNKENSKSGSGTWRWWPHLVVVLSVSMIAVAFLIGFMAERFPVPDDAPMEIPMPDNGEGVPGPEWAFLLFWAPFWYLKGRLKKWLFVTSVVPIILLIYLILLPFFHKIPFHRVPVLKTILGKARNMKAGIKKSLVYGLPAIMLFLVLSVGMYKTGHQAKTLGCDSCHNPSMGKRMAIPPVDVAKYYNVDRARQIGVGKYRAGKSSGVSDEGVQIYGGADEGGYKDADWQLRHMYEPTFTW